RSVRSAHGRGDNETGGSSRRRIRSRRTGAWSTGAHGRTWAGRRACRGTRRGTRGRSRSRDPPGRPACTLARPARRWTPRRGGTARVTARAPASGSPPPNGAGPPRDAGDRRSLRETSSQRNVPVLLRRILVALGLEDFQRLDELPPRVLGLDDLVDVSALG